MVLMSGFLIIYIVLGVVMLGLLIATIHKEKHGK